ncbi:HAMP domain-containing sensor histidine kinase [Streptomyces fuscichromogenes]|uniref:HAMP domain-containing sensor histidine kinase n=1 Tax=Streptomyces fuscichromogenes TaxID=1324013 RepID=UPI001E5A1887|nr:HAMP domain-containing sensor histidine kinase [Streptomyces fuscichromogenes]
MTLFLLSGTALLAIAAVVASGGSRSSRTAPGGGTAEPPVTAARAKGRIAGLEQQLAQAHDTQSRQILAGSAIALAVMAVISVALGWFVAGRVLRPLRVMTAATRRITADSLHERLAIGGPGDEVKDLADTIDDLLGRLEGSFDAQRLFVANASHELRTPLTTMRASLDVALAKPGPVPESMAVLATRIRTELDRVDRLLEGFLVLARTQHGEFTDSARLALGPLVLTALTGRAKDIAAKGLTVRAHRIDDSAWVWGSRVLLRRVADNVVDNAIAHNEPGGWISIAVRAEEDDADAVSLVVESGGPVLDQRRVAGLAQPFRRLGADRTGTGQGSGLGLSIVAAVTQAHHGILDLHARPDGGLRVTVTLPPADGGTRVQAPGMETGVAR